MFDASMDVGNLMRRKLTVDWKEFDNYLRFTPKVFKKRSLESGMRSARAVISRVREFISNNEGGYDIEYENRDTPPLFRTGEYAGLGEYIGSGYKGGGSFEYTILQNNSSGDWKIEVKPNDEIHYADSGKGLTNYQLGQILEQKFPHWRPIIEGEFSTRHVNAMFGELKLIFGNKKGQHLSQYFAGWGNESEE